MYARSVAARTTVPSTGHWCNSSSSSSEVYLHRPTAAGGNLTVQPPVNTVFVNEFTYPGEVNTNNDNSNITVINNRTVITAGVREPTAPGTVEVDEEPVTTLAGYSVRKSTASIGSSQRRRDTNVIVPQRMDNTQLAQTYKLSDQVLKQYQEAFRIFDRNGDGCITCQELGTVMRSLGHKTTQAELQDMINEVDVDGSGTIEFDEFVQMMSRRLQEKEEEDDGEEELKEAFEVFDRNKDGFISAEELRMVMRSLGENLTDQELNEMMKAADANGDGIINFNEFQEVWLEARRVASKYCM